MKTIFLASDNSIPEFHLTDFPLSYIYEKLLKGAIYDALPPAQKNAALENEFKAECKKLLDEYKATKSRQGTQ